MLSTTFPQVRLTQQSQQLADEQFKVLALAAKQSGSAERGSTALRDRVSRVESQLNNCRRECDAKQARIDELGAQLREAVGAVAKEAAAHAQQQRVAACCDATAVQSGVYCELGRIFTI